MRSRAALRVPRPGRPPSVYSFGDPWRLASIVLQLCKWSLLFKPCCFVSS
uniref:Uncharacterized protein n=1 Tax=Arundo donax TaxID=35708 RepID=A0A0A9GHP6_ARUDO